LRGADALRRPDSKRSQPHCRSPRQIPGPLQWFVLSVPTGKAPNPTLPRPSPRWPSCPEPPDAGRTALACRPPYRALQGSLRRGERGRRSTVLAAPGRCPAPSPPPIPHQLPSRRVAPPTTFFTLNPSPAAVPSKRGKSPRHPMAQKKQKLLTAKMQGCRPASRRSPHRAPPARLPGAGPLGFFPAARPRTPNPAAPAPFAARSPASSPNVGKPGCTPAEVLCFDIPGILSPRDRCGWIWRSPPWAPPRDKKLPAAGPADCDRAPIRGWLLRGPPTAARALPPSGPGDTGPSFRPSTRTKFVRGPVPGTYASKKKRCDRPVPRPTPLPAVHKNRKIPPALLPASQRAGVSPAPFQRQRGPANRDAFPPPPARCAASPGPPNNPSDNPAQATLPPPRRAKPRRRWAFHPPPPRCAARSPRPTESISPPVSKPDPCFFFALTIWVAGTGGRAAFPRPPVFPLDRAPGRPPPPRRQLADALPLPPKFTLRPWPPRNRPREPRAGPAPASYVPPPPPNDWRKRVPRHSAWGTLHRPTHHRGRFPPLPPRWAIFETPALSRAG